MLYAYHSPPDHSVEESQVAGSTNRIGLFSEVKFIDGAAVVMIVSAPDVTD